MSRKDGRKCLPVRLAPEHKASLRAELPDRGSLADAIRKRVVQTLGRPLDNSDFSPLSKGRPVLVQLPRHALEVVMIRARELGVSPEVYVARLMVERY